MQSTSHLILRTEGPVGLFTRIWSWSVQTCFIPNLSLRRFAKASVMFTPVLANFYFSLKTLRAISLLWSFTCFMRATSPEPLALIMFCRKRNALVICLSVIALTTNFCLIKSMENGIQVLHLAAVLYQWLRGYQAELLGHNRQVSSPCD